MVGAEQAKLEKAWSFRESCAYEKPSAFVAAATREGAREAEKCKQFRHHHRIVE